jgi:hypothetical protein
MVDLCRLIWCVVGVFRSRAALHAEILVLRHQLNVLRRKSPIRHLLHSYEKYYNGIRTHLSLHKDAPVPRKVQAVGRVLTCRS